MRVVLTMRQDNRLIRPGGDPEAHSGSGADGAANNELTRCGPAPTARQDHSEP